MQLQNEVKKKTYENYIQQYPSRKDFFENVISKDKVLHKIWYYTYLPTEKIDMRNLLKKEIQEVDYDHLLQRVTRERTKDLEILFDDYRTVEQADLVFINSNLLGKYYHVDIPPTIEEIRQLLGKVEQKTYYEGDKRVSERKICRYFPILLIIERNISNGKNKIEAEIQYFHEVSFEEEVYKWESFSVTEVLQKFKDMSEVAGIVWSLNPEVEYSIILSHGGEKKEFPVNLLDRRRYHNLIQKAMHDYPLESNVLRKEEDESPELRIRDYNDLKNQLNFSDAIMTILNLSLVYSEKQHGHFPGYLKERLRSHLRDIRRNNEFTTTGNYIERKQWDEYNFGQSGQEGGREDYRILISDLESSAGSINEENSEVELLHDKKYSEDSIINDLTTEELRKILTNPLDKEIFKKYYESEETMIQIANDLHISQPAISKRIAKMEEILTTYIKKNRSILGK